MLYTTLQQHNTQQTQLNNSKDNMPSLPLRRVPLEEWVNGARRVRREQAPRAPAPQPDGDEEARTQYYIWWQMWYNEQVVRWMEWQEEEERRRRSTQ